MSEYQRFVTYINLYEEDSKIRSVGFAKIERQQSQCSMEIHMRGTGFTGISCPVYLFVRKNEKMLGISVGKIPMNGGQGEVRLSLDAENISQSGYGLKEIGGFLIFVNDRVMFASLWDDGELRRSRFIPVEEAKKDVPPPERTIDQLENMVQEPEYTISQPTNMVQEPEHTAQQPENVAQQPGMTTYQSESSQTPVAENSPLQATEAAQMARQAVEEEEPWALRWKFILENYPILTPFEGEDNILCVRMELKDLRLLPKRHWYLGNNSFLLHGFFNYRYLILGAIEKEGTTRWFIGVPGVFQSQEKVMAAIFGFPEYKSEKLAAQKTGQFGYWYRFLE